MDRAGVGEMAEALATPAPDQEFGTVLDHATGAILNAQSFEAPYPLILFRDFFPAEFYRRLLKNFPANDRFVQLNGEGTRRQYNLYDERADPGSEEGRAAWSIVRRVLSSPEIASALRTKLDPGFRIRAKGSREGWPIPMFPRPVVYADLDGYAIKPHPDTRRKVLTMQIYLPADDTSATSARRSTRFRRWASSPGSPMASPRTRPCRSSRTPATRSSSSIRPIRC